jgi:ELWxxDGT repeat protein
MQRCPQLLFQGLNTANGADEVGLWTSDGTAAGTHEITGIAHFNSNNADPQDFIVFNGITYFEALNDANKEGLWRTDGTAAGTFEIVPAGAQAAGILQDQNGSIVPNFTILHGELLFFGFDTASNIGIWKTDGTAAGTVEWSTVPERNFDNGVFNGEIAAFRADPTQDYTVTPPRTCCSRAAVAT